MPVLTPSKFYANLPPNAGKIIILSGNYSTPIDDLYVTLSRIRCLSQHIITAEPTLGPTAFSLLSLQSEQ